MTTTPSRHRRAGRGRPPGGLLRLAAAVFLPAGLTAALSTPAGAAARTTNTARHPAVATTPALPGHAATTTLTLITGDRLTLTTTGIGHDLIGPGTPAVQTAGGASPLILTASGGPSGSNGEYAEPADASWLVSEGLVDKGLFSLARLAARETPAGGGSLPVIVQYTSGAALAHAQGLPGAIRVAAPAGVPDAAAYRVNLAHAAAFWTAITGAARPAPTGHAGYLLQQRLATGITRIWLAGDRPPAPTARPRPQDNPAFYTVTETVTGRGQPFTSNRCGLSTVCFNAEPSLYGLAGLGQGTLYSPTGLSCAVTNSAGTCTAYQITYQVPAGVYSTADAWADFELNDQEQNVDLDVPQFTVADDTRFTVSLSQAQPVTVTTPRPVEPTYGTISDSRTAPAGQYELSSITPGGTGSDQFVHDWAIPSPRITLGTFSFTTQYTLDKPQVTMTVIAPRRLTLHPWYPYAYSLPWSQLGAWRFSGTATRPLVDAGFGRTKDFAGKNVRGKLVLLRPYTPGFSPGPGCENSLAGRGLAGAAQLQNAIRAGAAGVIFDPTGTTSTTPALQGIDCQLPVMLGDGARPKIPFVSIPSHEATTLRRLLHHGRVTITTADSGPSPYVYNLKFYNEGGIPATLHHTVSTRQLATVHASYHLATSRRAQIVQDVAAMGPAESEFPPYFTGSFESSEEFFPGPASRTEYYGPLSPGVVWSRFSEASVNRGPGFGFDGDRWNVFSQPASTLENNFQQPYAPGAGQPIPADVLQAQPQPGVRRFYLTTCAGCRQGNTFWPVTLKVSGAQSSDTAAGLGQAGSLPKLVHLYQNGHEIQPTPIGGLAAYTLPPGKERYRLTVAGSSAGGDDFPLPAGPVNTHTTWDFTSAAVTRDQVPAGYQCFGTYIGVSTAPCAPDPLIFLRYNAFTNLTNSVTAPGTHRLRVTAYYQAPSHPAITSLKLWTSTDGGKTWQQAHLTGGHDGGYTATYTLPAASATNRYVSLKAQASDAAGNDITQQIINAYGIVPATPGK